jgi:hypothetical protein
MFRRPEAREGPLRIWCRTSITVSSVGRPVHEVDVSNWRTGDYLGIVYCTEY